MTDHESFLLLAARQVSEPLATEEGAALAAHLRECPACRSIVTAMGRDEIALRAQLVDAPVAPRVWQRVSAEASRRRRVDWRLVLALAAILLIPAIAVPLFAGGRLDLPPSSLAVGPISSSPATAAPPPTSAPATATTPLAAASPTPSPPAGFVAAAYSYGVTPPRRDTVSAHFDNGRPVGEWSRTIPATGPGNSYGGPITCMVISGSDAWLAGPATTVTDGTTDRAAMIFLHDGGLGGNDDGAELWLTTRGQTLATVTGWCEDRYIPAGPFPLAEGGVLVRDSNP